MKTHSAVVSILPFPEVIDTSPEFVSHDSLLSHILARLARLNSAAARHDFNAWRLAQSRAEGIRRVRMVQSREPSPFIGLERSKIDFRLTYRSARRRKEIDPAKYQEWLSLRNTVEGTLSKLWSGIVAARRRFSVASVAPSPLEYVSCFTGKPVLVAHADCFAGKSVLELCWEMCTRVQHLTRRIEILTRHGIPCDEERLEKRIAYPCFQHRVAGTEAYQKALRLSLIHI